MNVMECLGHLLADRATLGEQDILIECSAGPVWRYPSCGIGNVYVEGGITPTGTDNNWFKFDDLRGLHDRIADHFLSLPSPMKAEVFRFVRKEMLLTCSEAAQLIGAPSDEVSAWEDGVGFGQQEWEHRVRDLYAEWRRTRCRPDTSSAQKVA